MLIAVLIYLVIGALIMGGIYIANPDIIEDSDFENIFFSESNNINCIIGGFLFLAIMIIWLPVAIAVIIRFIADKFN